MGTARIADGRKAKTIGPMVDVNRNSNIRSDYVDMVVLSNVNGDVGRVELNGLQDQARKRIFDTISLAAQIREPEASELSLECWDDDVLEIIDEGLCLDVIGEVDASRLEVWAWWVRKRRWGGVWWLGEQGLV